MTFDPTEQVLPESPVDVAASRRGAVIQVEDATVHYEAAETSALAHFDFEVNAGEFISLLGHSGVGKTTALRVIAGFEKVQSGYVRIGGRLVASSFTHVPPDKRRVGLVFQDYALFPHLTVKANIEFGLNDMDRAVRKRQVGKMIELTGLSGYEKRYAHELSGGQQQRVALARALAPAPVAVLMDEPFSNLDRQQRSTLRREVRSILKDAGATAVLVTHDREEALALADRVGVMNDGRIEQIGLPEEVYANPISSVVARLVGACELVPGVLRGDWVETEAGRFQAAPRRAGGPEIENGASVLALMRASELELMPPDGRLEVSDLPVLRVIYREFRGEFTEFGVSTRSGLVIRVRRRSSEALAEGDEVIICARGISKVIVFPAD
jgi:iron(III) transport system ATP-binding protein